MAHTVFEGSIGYEGKVTLTLKNNDRVLKSKTYKNSGTNKLFEFLGYCLIDSYERVKALKPGKILLLKNSSDSPDTADPKMVTQQSVWTQLSQIPTIISTSSNAQVRVVYNFEVPKTSITGDFNQVALYGIGVPENEITEFSAFYYLRDSHNNFDVQKIADWSATTILLIEWELTISNKNTEKNNLGEV